MVNFKRISDIVHKYALRGVIIDSEPLLVLIVGKCNPSQLHRVGKYNEDDYKILLSFFSKFQRIIITHHIITELSNLANNRLKPNFKEVIVECASFLKNFNEQQIKKDKVLNKKEAQWLGFADASIIISSEMQNGLLVLSEDDGLLNECEKLNIDKLDLSSLRASF